MNLVVPPSGFSFRSSSVAPASLQLCSLPLSSLLELPPFLFPPSTQGLCCSLRSSDDVHPFFLSLLLTSHRSYINDSRHVAGSLLHAFKEGRLARSRECSECAYSCCVDLPHSINSKHHSTGHWKFAKEFATWKVYSIVEGQLTRDW